MFYSHTYLARKGPLGTVWCAAHLQHKLKKSHYSSTDILQTVERIIDPEVPLALRMSGHLLLGVVRIYSKKVDYLHYDCNHLWISLRNAFRAPDVNLPENATQAPFNAITLPDTFALDLMDIDDISLNDGTPDRHLRSEEEITLEDQHTTNTELYVRITFEDDIIQDSANASRSLHMDTEVMPIDNPMSHEPFATSGPGPNQTEESREVMRDRFNDDFHQSSIGIHEHVNIGDTGPSQTEEGPEKMRDRTDDDFLRPSPVLRHPVGSETLEQIIMSPFRDVSEKQLESPRSAHIPSFEMQLRQSPHHSGPSSPSPDEAPLESGSFVAARSEDLVVRPSPSPERPPPRRRKRKQYDETLVINNTFYSKALKDPSDLVKKRKKLPSSTLEMRRFINNKKEQAFSGPLISGMCTSLQNIFSQALTDLNPNLIQSAQVEVELRAAGSPEQHNDFTEETERIRSLECDPGLYLRNVFPSPPRSSPQIHGNAEIPTSPRIPSVFTEPRFDSTVGTESDHGFFTSSTMNMDTPDMNVGGTNDHQNTGLSDIPEFRSFVESDELLFLEQDNNSPSDSNGSQGDAMSVRTRAVAQYLKNHSPLSRISDDGPDDLSLNSILEGRSRKLCARMFYETLVLKSCDMIDVKQDEPYGDITLMLTPKISKAIISDA